AAFFLAADQPVYPRYFQQDNNFLYFTGLEIPVAILAFYCLQNKREAILFIERGIPELEVWDGRKMNLDEAKNISGLSRVDFLDQFDYILQNILPSLSRCFCDFGKVTPSGILGKIQVLADNLKKHYPQLDFASVTPMMQNLRNFKDDWEISQMKEAISATAEGILSIMRSARPGMWEYELEALFNYEVQRRGLHHLGFKSIIAAGVNAATLHYIQNNSQIRKGDLILLDVGAACQNYSADITRTFPVDGKFHQRQKDIYNEVLAVNQAIIGMCRPGISLPDLNQKTVELITQSLRKLGLINEDAEYKKYYMHSVSHHLGLNTHDLGSRESVLAEGNVITIEPGIYVTEENIGVRIEDDILITATGYENLTASVPKTVDELEGFLRQGRS
ncbi:MAG: aminopeptidase P family protein, partial [Candidatus Cloacimonetes bacterium]|nr:aminopeptidase P family protein [Candidatus Cloacimonadota bacterium]